MSDATIVETVDQTVDVAEVQKTEGQEVQNEVTQEPAAKPEEATKQQPVVVKLELHATALAIAEKVGHLMVKPTNSTGYRCLVPRENVELNWRKGLFYEVNQYAKGFTFEMKAYSVKKGAHLAEFNPMFQKLDQIVTEAGDKIQFEKLGLACRLRIKLPFSLGLEAILTKAAALVKAVNPTVEEVRALLKDEDFIKVEKKSEKKVVSTSETPAEAPVAAATDTAQVEEHKDEAPAVEPKAEVQPAAPKVQTKPAAKKNGKRK